MTMLNFIYIGTDTWRADYLGCYGNEDIKTPNLDKLAAEGVRFTNTYADGLPTIPMRRVFYTGKSILPHGLWCPLGPKDVTVAQLMQHAGYRTALFADCYHFFKPGMNLHQGYDTWEWIRGQEFDPWKSGPKAKFDFKDHVLPHWLEPVPGEGAHMGLNMENVITQYLMNVDERRSEDDYFCARTCNAAGDWLEKNGSEQPFMLWLEMFDPHEPWDAPMRHQKMYLDDPPEPGFYAGYGVNPARVREEDYPLIQGLYSAEVTFSDECIGRLIRRVEDLGLLDNTVILFSTDHGTHLGEEGNVQKTASLLDSHFTQLPFIVRHPDTAKYAGKKVDALTSGMDYAPTILSLADQEVPEGMDGKSVWPLVDGEIDKIRDEVYFGIGGFGGVRTADWHYFSTKQEAAGSDAGQSARLWDLTNDPGETKSVVDENPDVVKDLDARVKARFKPE